MMKRVRSTGKGFTIVELLIVVVVIAILAAITIVSYNGITKEAERSRAQSTASAFAKQAEMYRVKHGVYPTTYDEIDSMLPALGMAMTSVDDGYNYAYCALKTIFYVVPTRTFSDVAAGDVLPRYSSDSGWGTVVYDPNAVTGDSYAISDLCVTLIPGPSRAVYWVHST
jgi:prepilin-type N-terminal cleavage/methylation domain-containing protein